MADPVQVRTGRPEGGDARPGGAVRRSLFHAGLSVLASPLPGGLLVASRLLIAGRPVYALATLASSVAATGAVVLAAFLLPVSAPVACGVLILISAIGGAMIAWLERCAAIAPRNRVPGDRRLALRVVLWGLVVPVVWIPLAWFIAALSSPWGPEAIFKPSAQWRILLAALVWLVPFGVAIALARGLLERPFRVGAPVAFAATLPAILLTVLPGVGLMAFVHEGLLLPMPDPWPRAIGGDYFFYLDMILGILLFLVVAEYLSDGPGIGAFLLRCAAVAGVFAAGLVHSEVLNSALPVAVRQRIAYDQAARGDDDAAARSWRWILHRAPRSALTCRAVEQCALAAIRAGRPREARDAFEKLDARFLAEFPCAATGRVSAALLATPLDSAGSTAADADPVRPESYLDASWSAVLSAVRAALPDLSEAQLKDRLRRLSTDAKQIDLPRLDGFDDLRIHVRRLGCEAFAAPAQEIGSLLARGSPVLFRDPLLRRWGLLVWRAPAADAVVWLDYARWDAERERPLTRTEVRQLLRGDDRADPGRGAVSAEVRALGSESLLRARLAHDGGWVAVVVAATSDGEATAPAGVDVSLGEHLVRVWQARHSVEYGAYLFAVGLAGGLPPGPASSEIRAIGTAADEGGVPVEPTAGDRISPATLGRLSPWALGVIVDLGERISALACETRRLALEHLARDLPDDAALLGELLDQVLAAGEQRRAVGAAMDLARARSFDTAGVLKALEVTAPLAADIPEAKDAVAFLLDRLSPIPGMQDHTGADDAFLVRRRKALAPYCAARAALADRPQSVSRWWRQAVEIDPLRPEYRIRLAESLEAIGDGDEADRQRRAARDLAEVPACAQTPSGGPEPPDESHAASSSEILE